MLPQREPVRELARGKWHGLLGKWLDERALRGKHTSCPMCGGKDRFRLDNKDGAGTWICSHCGAGDGFHLLQHLGGFSFSEAAKYVERECGKIQAKEVVQQRSAESVVTDLRRVWGESKRLEHGDPVWRYLETRCGISAAPKGLRFHPALSFFDDQGEETKHPAMVAQVIGADDASLTLHRTYLTEDGRKADLKPPRKLMTPIRKLENVAVRLAASSDGWLGVAEGIETALCAGSMHDFPVWSCISAGLLRTFRPPAGTNLLAIFGDNDESFTGQSAAFELARAVTAMGCEARVYLPDTVGKDWADIYTDRR